MESRDKKKKFGLKRILNSIHNSIAGLVVAYREEQSMLLHLVASVILIILSFVFKINRTEWLFVVGIIGSTAAVELVNTALENVTDLATNKIHPLAKAAKDIASAAEFILCLMAFVMTLIIFIPKMT